MLIPLKRKMVRQSLACVLAVLAVTATAFVARISAQDSGAKDRIYVITHVDTLPSNGPALDLLQQYVADSRKDKGAIRIELLDQLQRANHFAFMEVWENQQAFEAHEAAAHTKKFRDDIQGKLGSPFDERLHRLVE